ncbi:MAG: hypothetical protein SVV80_07985, partial [Planctomycetota bacterium]|nr:hypothetical protein [Planctomycetota bacterium]
PNRNTSRFGGPKTPTTQPGAEGLRELSDRQWQQAQRQVAADAAQMVRQTPRAMHEALKTHGKQTTDLAQAARQLQMSQQALAKSTADEQGIDEMKEQLRQLAAEQAELARKTSQLARQSPKDAPTRPSATEASRATDQAAKALTTTQPASALPHQVDAVKALEQTARQAAAEQLAAAAEALAGKQQDLAKRSETARRFQAQAETARQSAAEKASGKIQDIAKDQTGLAKQVGQLKELAKQATQQAAAAMSRNDPSGNMQTAANRLRADRPDRATGPQTDATEQLRQLAKAARAGSKSSSPTPAGNIAAGAGELAQQQEQLRRRTAELTGNLARAQRQRREQELARLRAEQQQIARQAAALSDDVKSQAPQGDRIDTHSARSAAQAAKQLADNRLSEAAKSADKAGGELSELAGRLGGTGLKPVPPNPSPTAAERRENLAGRAGDLAQRQRQVGRQIADLAAEKMSQVLAGRQGQIAEQTKKTSEDVELLEEHIAELLPDAQAGKLAQSATKSLRQASADQGQARRAMSSGRPGQSIPSQQSSARSLAQAAGALAHLGRQFAAQAAKNPPAPAGENTDETPGQLAQAYDATQSAAQSQSAGQAAKAARLLAALAKQALQQARAMGMMPGAMGMQGVGMMRGSSLDSDARIGAAGTDLRAGELIELGISADDWARLPGRLRDQVLQAAGKSGPEEYRILIKRYFRALAKKAAEKNSSRKEETK